MKKDLKYEEIERRTREEVLDALRSGDPKRIGPALYSATHCDPDWRWVENQCLYFLHSSDVRVRWAAATCLGELAVFHKKLDLDRVIPELEKAASDEAIRAAVQDSLDEIRHNVKE